jgi:hypothetical protein
VLGNNYLSGDGSNSGIRLDSSGRVGIGTAAPATKLDVAGSVQFGINKGYLGYYNVNPLDQAEIGALGSSTSLSLVTNGISRLNITPAGSVGIGTNSPSYKLEVVGDIAASGCLRSSSGVASGTCASDERLKTDIQTFDLGLDALLGINPHTFKYNGLGEQPASVKSELGVIAQEVEKTAPELIVTKDVKLRPEDAQKTEIKQVNYTAFTYVLINAVKDLYHRWFDDSQAIHRELASKDEKIQKLELENAAKTKQLEDIKSWICAKDPQAAVCK